MTFYNEVYSKLACYLTIERIEKANEVFEKNLLMSTNVYTDKSHWYAVSYSEIIKIFEETRDSVTQEAWVRRLAMVSSWLPTILSPSFNADLLEELNWLERQFYEVKLEKVKESAYLGEANTPNHGERIFSVNYLPPVLIKSFVSPVHQLTSKTAIFDNNLSTTTKILHFMYPHLFPIYDKKIHMLFFKGKQNYVKYHAYIFALRQWLEVNKDIVLPTLEYLACKHNVSVIRIIDQTLFQLAFVK